MTPLARNELLKTRLDEMKQSKQPKRRNGWYSYNGINWFTDADTRVEITKGSSGWGFTRVKKLGDKTFADMSPTYGSLDKALAYAIKRGYGWK